MVKYYLIDGPLDGKIVNINQTDKINFHIPTPIKHDEDILSLTIKIEYYETHLFGIGSSLVNIGLLPGVNKEDPELLKRITERLKQEGFYV